MVIKGGFAILITKFNFSAKCAYADLAVTNHAVGMAITDGRAADLALILEGAAYGSLVSNVNVGAGWWRPDDSCA